MIHLILGMTIFLLFPFSRLVHVWSGFATIAYLFRPYQVVRSRRLNVPAGHNLPRATGRRRLTERCDDKRNMQQQVTWRSINGVALHPRGCHAGAGRVAPAGLHGTSASGRAAGRTAARRMMRRRRMA